MISFTPEQVVRALYLGVLGREPDEGGLAVHARMIRDDPALLPELAAGLDASGEHRERMLGKPGLADHSQDGEYPVLLRRLVRIGQRHGIIVDVGARGRDRSNSYDLLKDFGWKGLLVEANPALDAAIRREFDGLDFRLESCAIGIETGILPFYLGINDDVSSLTEGMAAAWGAVQGRIEVEVRRLGPLLEKHDIPHDFDILSLDIEGMDIPVLNDLIATTPYRPATILIEASFGYQTKSLMDVDVSDQVRAEYDLVAQTAPNLILGRKDKA